MALFFLQGMTISFNFQIRLIIKKALAETMARAFNKIYYLCLLTI